MAGIGFELRRALRHDGDLTSVVRGYASAGLVAAGPWVMTITGLSFLNAFAHFFEAPEAYALFRALVTYAFVLSLIIVGPLQMAYTRHLADAIYGGRGREMVPALVSALQAVIVATLVAGSALAAWVDLPLTTGAAATALTVVLGMTWIALIWLSVTKDYMSILRAYAWGSAASVGCVLLLAALGLAPGTTGAAQLLVAFTVGPAATLALLLRAILRVSDSSAPLAHTIQRAPRRLPLLALVGCLYNIGIWMDSIVVWTTQGVEVHPGISFHPLYDTSRFLAYLTVIPALAINLVRVETAFDERYRRLYGSILGGATLGAIERCRREMLATLREGTLRLLRLQGAVSVLILICAPGVLHLLHVPLEATAVFRAACLGSLFHVFLLVTLLILLYLDLQWEAAATAGVFLVANAAGSMLVHHQGIGSVATAYAGASLLALLVGVMLLERASAHLVRRAFLSQPLESGPRASSASPHPASRASAMANTR